MSEPTNKWSDLTAEQRAKAKNCTTPEEVLALAKEEGYELTDEELESINGGMGGNMGEWDRPF